MLRSNVQTIQDRVRSNLVKQTVRTLATAFLSNLSGTPVHKVEATLGPDRKTLPELTLMDFLWSGDGMYFPAFCALYLLGEPTWSEQERHVHSFLEFARDLYAERGVGPHRLRDICTELANGGSAPIQPISIIVGAHFSRSFGSYYHSFQGCPRVDLEPGTAIEVPEIQFHLAPNILDYKDLDTSWEEQIKSRLLTARTPSVPAPAVATMGSENGSDQRWDVFMSHASEDKGYCEPLAKALEQAGIRVWLDKTALQWGDDLRSAIDRGLRNCRYGIVIFSKAFLRKKKWTEYELSSLFALEKVSEKRILPIWHGITRDDLLEYSAGLADRLAKVSSSDGYQDIVNSLCAMLGRSVTQRPHEIASTSKVKALERQKQVAANVEPIGAVLTEQNSAGIFPSRSYTGADLSTREIELLWNAAKDSSGQILHTTTLDGESIRTNGIQFLQNADARTAAEWITAFGNLEKRGFIEPLSYESDFFRVTGDGYRVADSVEGFARWDTRSVVLRAHYVNARSEELTLSCTGIIAIPARYFEDRIGADGTVQRSLKESPSLIVEGIASKPRFAWTPTEIEFFDQVSKQVQRFRVEGMEFAQPRCLKLSLDAGTVRLASHAADDGQHEFLDAGLLSATAELTTAEPESKPDGFTVGSRNAWVRFLEQCWPTIGPRILAIANGPASTIEDVRQAFLPAKEHPYDSGLATHFYRERSQQATPADVVSTGIRLDGISAEVLQAIADRDQAARSCTEVDAVLALATNPKEKEQVQREAQRRKGDLAQLSTKLAHLQRTQTQLEETFRDQQAYVCRSETLAFLLSAEHLVDPRHIANAVAALPRKSWRESFALCSPIPFDTGAQHEYQVLQVISAILKDHSPDLDGAAVETFRRELLKLPAGRKSRGTCVKVSMCEWSWAWKEIGQSIDSDSRGPRHLQPSQRCSSVCTAFA
jgi:TIR domain